MRTYMQDIDATGETNPVNRVSLHESTKRDGVFDKHTVFADGLLPPREVLPLADRVLINETNTSDIFAYFESKNTGVSDKKELFYKGGPRGGNLEHQPSGLVWDWTTGSTRRSAICVCVTPGECFRTATRPATAGSGVSPRMTTGKYGSSTPGANAGRCAIRPQSSTADSICPTTARRIFRKSGRWSVWRTCREE